MFKIDSLPEFLSIGTCFMIILALYRKNKYGFSSLQAILLMLALVCAGVGGAYLMFYIENGYFAGISYFGAVLFMPLILFPISKVMKIPFLKVIGYCSPAECAMLGVMKFHCMVHSCCGGNELYNSIFPIKLQLLEALGAIIIMLILVKLENKNFDTIYPSYLCMYGAFRLIINSFREGLVPFVWILPAGHFWAIVSIIVGVFSLSVLKNKNVSTHKINKQIK